LLKAPPDPLHSQFRATYTSLLNLLDAFGEFTYLRDIAEKSFAFRQTRHQIDKLKKQHDEHLDKIATRLSVNGYGLSIETVRGFERLASALIRLQENLPNTRAELRHQWLRENVSEGRIITQGRSGKRLFMVLNVHGDAVSAMRDDGQGTTLPLDRVNRVYEKKYPVRHDTIEQAFFDVLESKNHPLNEPKVSFKKHGADDAAAIINGLLDQLVPVNLAADARSGANQLLWDERGDAEALTKIERDIAFLRDEIWLPFERRAKVLGHFKYLDFHSEKVTERGKWLADLRIDRPLLAGEALRRGVFDDLLPKYAAGMMAALAADPDRNYGEMYLSDRLVDLLSEFETVIYDVSKIEWNFGVEPAEDINYSAAAAAERWADGIEWGALVAKTKAEEGDLVRLLSRTGEALMQVAQLKEANPKAAEIARITAEIVLREPVR
jgi:Superfamily II RNA helicase